MLCSCLSCRRNYTARGTSHRLFVRPSAVCYREINSGVEIENGNTQPQVLPQHRSVPDVVGGTEYHLLLRLLGDDIEAGNADNEVTENCE